MARDGIGRPGRIDHVQMRKKLQEGWTHQRIAEYFNVSRSAVSQAVRAQKRAVVRNVVLESAGKIVASEIDSFEQLTRANQICNDLVEDLRVQLYEDDSDLSKKDIHDLIYKGLGEIRRQLALQASIFEKMVDFQAVAAFQQEVIEIINSEVDHEQKRRIIERLRKRRSLRTVSSLDR